MLTGELKNKIDGIWTILWTEGSTNPLTNIEQITYLLFMKNLDEIETGNESDGELFGWDIEPLFPKDKQEYRWKNFKQLSAKEMFEKMHEEIFPFVQNLQGDEGNTSFSRYMRDARFTINKPATLQRVVDAIDTLPTDQKDIKGDIYEYLLSKLQTSGTNGQFRTPRHIIDMMVRLTDPTPRDIICDPAAGFRVIIVIEANSYVNTRSSRLLPKFKTQKINSWCAA